MKDVMFIFLYNIYGLPFPEFQKTSNSNNNNLLLLLFDGLWKVKDNYVVLCLNASPKLLNLREASRLLALIGICLTWSHMFYSYQSSEVTCLTPINPVNSPLQVMWGTWDSVATREVPLEKNVELKCMQVNVLKSVTRIKKRKREVVAYKLTI